MIMYVYKLKNKVLFDLNCQLANHYLRHRRIIKNNNKTTRYSILTFFTPSIFHFSIRLLFLRFKLQKASLCEAFGVERLNEAR